MDVGRILKKIIERENITLIQLEERSEFTQARLSQYIHGHRTPRIDTFARILEVMVYELLVVNADGKMLRFHNFGVVVDYIMRKEDLKITKLATISGTDNSGLRRYIRGEVNPTMLVADKILVSVNYAFKVAKKRSVE